MLVLCGENHNGICKPRGQRSELLWWHLRLQPDQRVESLLLHPVVGRREQSAQIWNIFVASAPGRAFRAPSELRGVVRSQKIAHAHSIRRILREQPGE